MSELVKVKASEIEGDALDWAVAKSRGGEYKPFQFATNEDAPLHDAWVFPDGSASTSYRPSTDWAQGGPLIEQHGLCVGIDDTGEEEPSYWAFKDVDGYDAKGSTMLIAVMRAIVASELGDTVEVPKELVA